MSDGFNPYISTVYTTLTMQSILKTIVPTHGHYCGPYSDSHMKPVDELDALCAAHDNAYSLGDYARGDADFIDGLVKINAQNPSWYSWGTEHLFRILKLIDPEGVVRHSLGMGASQQTEFDKTINMPKKMKKIYLKKITAGAKKPKTVQSRGLSRTTYVKAPTSIGAVTRYMPQGNTYRMNGSYQCGAVTTGMDVKVNTVLYRTQLHPSAIGGRLEAMSQLWQEYRVLHMRMIYRPASPTTTGGSLMFYGSADVNEECTSMSVDTSTISEFKNAVSFEPWMPASFNVPIKRDWLYCTYDAMDPHFCVPGFVAVVANTPLVGGQVYGLLTIEYEVEFRKASGFQNLNNPLIAQTWFNRATSSGPIFDFTAHPEDLAASAGSNWIVKNDRKGAFYLKPYQRVMAVLVVKGTGLVKGNVYFFQQSDSPVQISSNANVDSGATCVNYFVDMYNPWPYPISMYPNMGTFTTFMSADLYVCDLPFATNQLGAVVRNYANVNAAQAQPKVVVEEPTECKEKEDNIVIVSAQNTPVLNSMKNIRQSRVG